MKMRYLLRIVLLTCSLFLIYSAQAQKNNITITFINSINKVPVVLDSENYSNCWNEHFTISKLKYYITNIKLQAADNMYLSEENSYHLVDEADSASKSFSFYMPPNKYRSLSFLIGVDSLKNVSGAQTDALDPLNAMFWAWNTGYIMFKLEGNSPQSTNVNNKIEYHIGGFAGKYNVLRKIHLNLEELNLSIKKNKNIQIVIDADVGKIWNIQQNISIGTMPVCATPGEAASKIADNYSKAFKIIKIVSR